jgi:hypothetical protein
MTHVNDLHLLAMQDRFNILRFIYYGFFLLNLIFSINSCLYLTTIICILHFSNLLYSQIIFKRCLKNCVDPFSFSLQKYIVHDLNPTCNSDNPDLTIIFFHGIAFGTNDEWKETWTTCPLRVEWMEPELRSLCLVGDYCGPVSGLDFGGPLGA